MPSYRSIVTWSSVVFVYASLQTSSCLAADLEEIIRRGTAAIQSDWAADADYAYVEREEVQKGESRTSKTQRLVMIAGSDYKLTMAINDQPLSPSQQKENLEKLKREFEHRNNESPSARQRRIDKYKKQRDENGALLLDFPNAFNFKLVREETIKGHPAYVLSGTPKKRTGSLSHTAKVLSGMRGTLWIDKENFHTIRAECEVLAPVSIYGPLARVLPGTHIEFSTGPVTGSTWLVGEFSMAMTLSKLMFKSKEVTHSTYTDYRLNAPMVDELLSKANQP